MAVFGALVLSIIAAVLVANYLDNIDIIPSISASQPTNCTDVAINNYPVDVIAKAPKDSKVHKPFEDAMDENYRCSKICIPGIDLSGNKKLTDSTNLKVIRTFLEGATIGGQQIVIKTTGEEFKAMLSSDSEKKKMAQTIILNSTKPNCEGAKAGSTSGASIDYEKIVSRGGNEVELKELNCTISALSISSEDPYTGKKDIPEGCPTPTAPVAADNNANPANPAATGPSNPAGSAGGSGNPSGAPVVNNPPATASSPEVAAVQQCWNDFFKAATEHMGTHLGIVYPEGHNENKILYNLKREFVGDDKFNSLHPGGGVAFFNQIEGSYNEYKGLASKKNGIDSSNSVALLDKCKKNLDRISSSDFSTARKDMEDLDTCKNELSKKLAEINKAGVNILGNTNISWSPDMFGYSSYKKNNTNLKGLQEYIDTFFKKIDFSRKRYQDFPGQYYVNFDRTQCESLKQKLNNIINKTPALSEGSKLTKVYVVGNVAISNNDLNSHGLANNISVRDPIHVCVYLDTVKGGKTECKAIKTQRRDGGFWVDFDVNPDALSELVNSYSGKKVFVYAVWNATVTSIRNRYISFSPNQGGAVTMASGKNKSGQTEYTISIHKPIVLYGQASAHPFAPGQIAGSIKEPTYGVKDKNMVVEELKRFMAESGSENCLFRGADTLPNPIEWKDYKKDGPN